MKMVACPQEMVESGRARRGAAPSGVALGKDDADGSIMPATEPPAELPSPPASPFQFRLRTMLIVVTAIAVFLGYTVNYNVCVGIVMTALAAVVSWFLARIVRQWNRLSNRQRFLRLSWRCDSGSVACVVWCSDRDRSKARNMRAERALQRAVLMDGRFSGIQFGVSQIIGPHLNITGSVKTEEDLKTLREILQPYECEYGRGISWSVKIESSGRVYGAYGRDSLHMEIR